MKIKTLLFTFLISIIIGTAKLSAQNCPNYPINLSSQQQVDDFSNNYSGCTEFDVDINIVSSDSDEIQNLNGLIQIKKINGNLHIEENESLLSLSGLDSLQEVKDLLIVSNINLANIDPLKQLVSCKILRIKENTNLQNIDGLQSLQEVSSHLFILENNNLSNINGLSELTSVGKDFLIRGNPLLNQLNSINALQSIGQSLIIENNNTLYSLTGFSSLNHIGGDLSIYSNNLLTNFIAPPQIKETLGSVNISNNPSLISLEGLQHIKLIKGGLKIFDNDKLTNLKGLEQLEFISGNLRIESNSFLINLEGLESLEGVGRNFDIQSNYRLKSFKGLSKIKFIGRRFFVFFNSDLENLEGINTSEPLMGINLIHIKDNDRLGTLQGLENLDFTRVTAITIENNKRLDRCAVQSICTYLSNCKTINLNDNSSNECNISNQLQKSCKANSDINYQQNCISHLYPNPVNDILSVRFEYSTTSTIKYDIIDMQNRLLLSGEGNVQSIDVSKLVPGIYSLRIQTVEQTKTLKFVKN